MTNAIQRHSLRLHTSPKKHHSPKKTILGTSNLNLALQNENYSTKPSSPTRLDFVACDWNPRLDQNVPVLASPPKSVRSRSPSPTRSDRFIPTRRSTTSLKLYGEKSRTPLPKDSPEKHIEYQSSRIYKHSMAQLCGIDSRDKVLQFNDRTSFSSIFDLQHLTLSDSLSQVVKKSVAHSSGPISPSRALARARKMPTIPEKTLDAPGLVDDYYLDLVSWSCCNVLAVALDDAVYLYKASEGTVDLLTTCNVQISSVNWSGDGSYLSIGKVNGQIEIWDIEENTKLRTMTVGSTRIASHDWSEHILTCGSVPGIVYHNDVRISKHITSELKFHEAEVCGVKWRNDGQQFITGGNDNIVNIWDARSESPLFTKKDHTAAIKALSWCDDQRSLVATGGGANDKNIHFWNSHTGAKLHTINTGSQITSVHWGRSTQTGPEIVATTGFPNNAVSVYSYKNLHKIGEIVHPHEGRILYSALSPDGKTLATAAGDENLKFWEIFDERCEREEEMMVIR